MADDDGAVTSEISAEVALRDGQAPVISAAGEHEWNTLWTQANALAKSGIVPYAVRGKPADIMVIWLTGRELQIPPMQALGKINVIEGKAAMSAELMASLVMRAGHEIVYEEQSANACRLKVRRRGQEAFSSFEFTIDDAVNAGLVQIKDGKLWSRSQNGKRLPWEQYPKSMLSARAISLACRAMFPDVMMGVSYVPEELGANVDPITGEIISDPEVEVITDDEVAAFMHRIKALPDAYQGALRDTLKERSWVVRRLPARLKNDLDNEIAGLEQWVKPEQTETEPGEAVEAEIVPGVGETEPADDQDEAVAEAELVEEAGSEAPGSTPPAQAAPAAPPASEDLPPGGMDAPSPKASLPGGGESPGGADQPEQIASAPVAPENGPGGGEGMGTGDGPSPEPSPGPGPAVKTSTKSQWTKLAIAAGEAGLDDDARHELCSLISFGRTASAKTLTHREAQWAINTCREITAGHVRIEDYDPEDGETAPYRTVVALDELGLKFVDTLTSTLGAP